MSLKDKIVEISDQLLSSLLEYRKSHPDFRFWMRSREHNKAGDQERLSKGQWFQGSDYIFLSFHSASGHVNMTRSIGWVVEFDKDFNPHYHISIVWPSESDPRKVNLYKDLIASLGGFKSLNETKWRKDLPDEEISKSLHSFIEGTRLQINSIIEKHGLAEHFTIPESKFQKQLERVLFHRTALHKHSDVSYTQSNSIKRDDWPLNLILYGPPGTGKTYNTVLRAAEIISSEDFKGRYEAAKVIYDKAMKEGQVEFITFHQNYSYEDFVQGLRPKIESANQLMFEKRDGVFKKLADEALKNLIESSTKEVSVEPTFDEVFDEFFKPLIDETGTISIQMESKDYQFVITKYNPEIENFSFTKQNGGQGHAIYIPTLKKYFEQPDIDHTQGLKYYYRPLAKALHKKAEQLKKVVSNVKRKNYVLIIDEINRANISRVFGELITLLEEDKRWDNKHKLKVRLPSGDEFTVPRNLYIIGTMNTADKSIALVDIALRRRFRFEPMYPDSTIEGVRHGDILDKLNAAILPKKEADFLVGHSYFMNDENGYFSLADTMNFKVIPLLNEYFYNQRGDVVKTVIETAISGTGMKVEKDKYGQLQFMEGE